MPGLQLMTFPLTMSFFTHSSGHTRLLGEVENGHSKACSAVLDIRFLGCGQQILEMATSTISKIDGGETTLFWVQSSVDYPAAASHKTNVTNASSMSLEKSPIEFSNLKAIKSSETDTRIEDDVKNIGSTQVTIPIIVGAYDRR